MLEDESEVQTSLLRDSLEEMLNSMEHLQRTQTRLEEYLTLMPHDIDLQTAYNENKIVAAKKARKLIEIHDNLMRTCPAYRLEKETRKDLSRPSMSIEPLVQVITPAGGASGFSALPQLPALAGFYL